MTELVPADQIETIVGARRHQTAHIARAVTAEQTVYILHAAACRISGIDLRKCEYSKALDRGIELDEWEGLKDQAVTVRISDNGLLTPSESSSLSGGVTHGRPH